MDFVDGELYPSNEASEDMGGLGGSLESAGLPKWDEFGLVSDLIDCDC